MLGSIDQREVELNIINDNKLGGEGADTQVGNVSSGDVRRAHTTGAAIVAFNAETRVSLTEVILTADFPFAVL